MVQDVYLQPAAPDPVLDEAAVLAIVRQHVPDAQSVTAVDESGGEARTYSVNAGPAGSLILKTQRPHRLRPRTSLEKEAFFLRQLAGGGGFPVPRVYGYGRAGGPAGNVEYICMSRMPGVAAVHAILSPTQKEAVLRDLGRTLRRLHALPHALFTRSGLFPGDQSAEDLVARVRTGFESATRALQQRRGEGGEGGEGGETALSRLAKAGVELDHLAARAVAALPRSDVRAALHSNPGPMHTFVDPEQGTFTGLIDFGDAYVSHPAFDLVRWPPPEERQMLLAGYRAEAEVDDAFLRVWRVAQVLTLLSDLARGRAPDAPTQLHRLLADL